MAGTRQISRFSSFLLVSFCLTPEACYKLTMRGAVLGNANRTEIIFAESTHTLSSCVFLAPGKMCMCTQTLFLRVFPSGSASHSFSRGAVDILEGTAQRRPFQFVVIWIGDAQSMYLQTLLVTSWYLRYMVHSSVDLVICWTEFIFRMAGAKPRTPMSNVSTGRVAPTACLPWIGLFRPVYV